MTLIVTNADIHTSPGRTHHGDLQVQDSASRLVGASSSSHVVLESSRHQNPRNTESSEPGTYQSGHGPARSFPAMTRS